MQLKSDYYDTDFEFAYKGNTILIRNDGPEGESLFVNGTLQDQNFGAHNGHLIGHLFDGENNKEVLEIFLGGSETKHCRIYANGELIHIELPPIEPVMSYASETPGKGRKPNNYLITLIFIVMAAAIIVWFLPHLKTDEKTEPAGSVSIEKQKPEPAKSVSMDGGAAASDSEGFIDVNYNWHYGKDDWSYEISIPVSTYEAYKTIDRKTIKNYGYYVTDQSDDTYMADLAAKFKEAALEGNYSSYDMVKNIIFFVQNLNYVDDKVGTGYDEYPKFPLETLADEGGDCEDSAILLASLLRELNYDTVLIQFSDHMAAGIKGNESLPGNYFEQDGKRYYYVETTSPGWDIGEMPEQIADQPAKILTLNR